MRFLTLLLLLLSVSVFAQPRLEKHYSCHHYTTYDGLVQSQVNRMMQDSKGYIWICTKGGLSRWDGKKFQNFTDEKDGQRINIWNIFEQEDGYLVCSGTKLWKFRYEEENPGNWTFEDVKIPDIYRFHGLDFLFFNKNDSCFYLFNLVMPGYGKDQFIHIKFNVSSGKTAILPIGEKKILCSFSEDKQRIFISTNSKITFKNGLFIIEKLLFSIDAITPDPTDSTFVAYQKSTKTIYRVDKKIAGIKKLFDNTLINSDATSTLVVNNSGYITYLSDLSCINYIHQNRETLVDKVTLAKCLLVDRENNLWVGTEEGVYNYFQLGFEQYVFNIGKTVDNVWSIVCAPDSTMWFGGYLTSFWSFDKNEQINLFQPERYIPKLKPGELANNFYMGGICDSQGRVYLPLNWGFLIIENNIPRYVKTTDSGVPMSMFDDNANNKLVLGQSDGFTIIEKGTWKILFNSNLMQSVVSTCMTRSGKILAGTFRKQYIFDKDSLKPFRPEQNLGVISMVRDKNGNIWKGTPVGLFFDNGVKDSAVFAENIRGSISAVFIKHPWLMTTTVSKMYMVNVDSFYNNKTTKVLEFGSENGYIAMDGGQNGFCEDNEGMVWYSVADKVLRFSPEEATRNYNVKIPKPHIASISFSKNAIDWERVEICDSSLLIRSHQYNSIRFSMVAISTTRSDQITYQYCILGLSDEWSKPTSITQQSFTNLAPGKYQIEIRCSYDNKNWSETTSSPLITIKKAWWQFWWTYLIESALIVIMITVVVAFIVRRRQKVIIQKLTEQKRLNELRLQSVRSKHIPHFSGNALANIEHFIFSSDLRQANKFLSKYSRLMNITLRDADKASRTIEQELEYVNLYLELEKMRFGESLEYSIKIDPLVNINKEIPNMLLQTWVENAIKHGIRHKEGVGSILVKITKTENNGISIRVEDNGVGRAKAKEMGTTGTGQGLKILAEQVGIYNQFNSGKIILNTTDLVDQEEIASGTRFEMTIPGSFNFDV
jgi:hypothetical protein